MKARTAQKLVDFGFKQLSRFGRWCPVKLMEKQPIPPYYSEDKKMYTVIHRSFIYYLNGKEAKKKFSENPIKYLRQPSPLPVVPFRLSIIGPPKSGKSSLADRFSKEFGTVRLSVGEAIRAVLNNQPNTALAQEIRQYLFKGKTCPDELAIQCLEISILDVKCQLRGYVLDGFPNTKNQVKLLTDRGLIPVKVIELKCDIKEIMQRCIKDRTVPDRLTKNLILNDSPEIIGYKLREWKKEIGFIRDWYNYEHKNLMQLDATESKWSLWEKSKHIAFESVELIQVYLNRVSEQKAASIAKLCVTYDEMKARLGDFGQYCPVCLALREELVDCSEYREMDYVAEFQGYYYKMSNQENLNIFLDSPKDFVAPNAPRKLPAPHLLPRKLTATEVKKIFPKGVIQAELNGYCSVTFYDGKQRYEAIIQGSIDFAVEYKGKVFYMTSNEMREKFMKKPEIYGNLKLPHKLPPVTKKMDVFSLPMTGFLEQTVAELVKKSLNEVGNYKPKFPFLSPTRSSLLYVAYYLKAFNPRSSEYRRKKYKQKLMYFEEKCELINYLYSQTTLKYKEPARRTIEYNSKFESFFALQDNAPTMNWLA